MMRPKAHRLNCEHVNRGVQPEQRGVVAYLVALDGWRKYVGGCCLLCALSDHHVHMWIDRQVDQFAVWSPWLKEVAFESDPVAPTPFPVARLVAFLAYRDRVLPRCIKEIEAILLTAGIDPDPEARRQRARGV